MKWLLDLNNKFPHHKTRESLESSWQSSLWIDFYKDVFLCMHIQLHFPSFIERAV